MRSLLIIMIFVIFAHEAFSQEGNLVIPMDFENTKVLPKGVRNVRYRNVQFQAVDKFDGAGNSVPVGSALNKGVTWNKVIEGKDTELERGILKGYLESKGVNLNDEVGSTTGNVGIDFKINLPVLAWGITEKMTMAMAVPIVTTSLRVDAGFMANSNAAGIGNTLMGDGQSGKAYELRHKLAYAVQEKLRKYNYKPLQSREDTRVGDIRLINKYLFYQKKRVDIALKSVVALPTGSPTDHNRAVDIGSGDGQWDVGVGVTTDWQATEGNTFSAFAGAIAQLPTQRSRRIPEEKDSKLTPDVDKNTKVDLGDQLSLQLGHKYSFLKGFNVSTAYNVQYKGPDKYTGNKYSGERYRWLSQDTEQTMQTGHLGVGYSTIDLFRAKRFPVPLDSNLSFNKVLNGRNAIDDYLVSFEMAVYF